MLIKVKLSLVILSAASSVLPCRKVLSVHRRQNCTTGINSHPTRTEKGYSTATDKTLNFIVAFQGKNEIVFRIFDRISNPIILHSNRMFF